MVYQYIAYNGNKEIIKGRLTATSKEVATDLLGHSGYQVISLKPTAQLPGLERLTAQLFPIKSAEVILFYRQLALLLEAGIDIITSLELLREQASNRTMGKALDEVVITLRNGEQLSKALSKHPRTFAPVYCRLVAVGEQTGDLETILRQIADYMEKEAAATKDVKNALKYPVVISIVAVVVVGVLITTVFPALGDLYGSLGSELPPITKLLITAAEKVQSYGLYLITAALVIAGIAFAYIKTPEGKYKRDKLYLTLPLLGRINHLKSLALCCRSFALLFRAGLPLTEIMPLVIQGSNNRVMSEALVSVQQDMLQGEGLSRPMGKNPTFMPMMVQMVRVGEETGRLDNTLLSVAQSYDAEAEEKTRAFIGLIQPTLTLAIGLIVGFIALSMVSAMYSVYGQGF